MLPITGFIDKTVVMIGKYPIQVISYTKQTDKNMKAHKRQWESDNDEQTWSL